MTMNNNPMHTSEALARLQAAAEYAARPNQSLAGAKTKRLISPDTLLLELQSLAHFKRGVNKHSIHSHG